MPWSLSEFLGGSVATVATPLKEGRDLTIASRSVTSSLTRCDSVAEAIECCALPDILWRLSAARPWCPARRGRKPALQCLGMAHCACLHRLGIGRKNLPHQHGAVGKTPIFAISGDRAGRRVDDVELLRTLALVGGDCPCP